MQTIHGQQLTTFAVSPDGGSFAIHVSDEEGRPASLVLPAECLSALLMTLPEMQRQCLARRFDDESMRVVYPVGEWKVEGGEPAGTVIVTLKTPDGFQVSFALPAFGLLFMASQAAHTSSQASGIIQS